ncbi:ABC transporter permease [Rubrimonas sp.]|uniref:ABC transporter permease n=1 Tax=Rubrimonas sp. TaxID=2036015 RepID=UPI002FDE984D
MNLAFKDIRHNLARFVITLFGVGLLITASVGMVGLYRGIVADATLLIDRIGPDYWVVQGGKAGPFAESSLIASTMDRRVAGLAGVARVRRFMQSDQQIVHAGVQRRATLVGLDYTEDEGDWIELVRGRPLAQGRYEVIADASLGFAIGDRIDLARDTYEVVGIAQHMISAMGDGLIFVTINDALDIARHKANEEVRLARAASGLGAMPAESKIAAILVDLDPGADAAALVRTVMGWGDANILSNAAQTDLFLNQRLWRLRVQVLAFTAVLLAVMAIVIALIVYTMTLEKLTSISLLKLIGARDGMIYGMIVQQAALIGIGGYAVGVALAHLVFPLFPRRVVLDPEDLAVMLGVVLLFSLLAAQLGIRRAMRTRAQDVLS